MRQITDPSRSVDEGRRHCLAVGGFDRFSSSLGPLCRQIQVAGFLIIRFGGLAPASHDRHDPPDMGIPEIKA